MKRVLLLLLLATLLMAVASAQCTTGQPRFRFVYCCDGSITVGGGCGGLDGQCQYNYPGTLCYSDGITTCYAGDASSCSLHKKRIATLALLDKSIIQELGRLSDSRFKSLNQAQSPVLVSANEEAACR